MKPLGLVVAIAALASPVLAKVDYVNDVGKCTPERDRAMECLNPTGDFGIHRDKIVVCMFGKWQTVEACKHFRKCKDERYKGVKDLYCT
ncbi:hypothetical protein IQ06DRAFT_296963 [Phaeosphaeriaceae sp. SRC1lsM3a]|nr:hypothetical protein IQ06DRAFT_296963 [Stagonospora sp. SRC1lsM3a]